MMFPGFMDPFRRKAMRRSKVVPRPSQGSFKDRKNRKDPLLPLKTLAEIYGVPKVRLIGLERAGLVEFQWRRFGPWLGRIGRPSWLVHLPVYDCSDAAKIIGVTARTVRTWAKSGLILREQVRGQRRRRISPHEVFRRRREYREDRGKVRVPTLDEVIASDRARSSRAGDS
jgi:hypothetical protein